MRATTVIFLDMLLPAIIIVVSRSMVVLVLPPPACLPAVPPRPRGPIANQPPSTSCTPGYYVFYFKSVLRLIPLAPRQHSLSSRSPMKHGFVIFCPLRRTLIIINNIIVITCPAGHKFCCRDGDREPVLVSRIRALFRHVRPFPSLPSLSLS